MDDPIRSPDMDRANRVPPGQHETERWPVLHADGVPRIDLDKWTFSVSGLVVPERTLRWREFVALPHVEVLSDIHCVTRWSRLNNRWEGVPTSAIRGLTEVSPEARFVIVHAEGGFTTNLPIDDFFAEDALFALKHDGQDIAPEHGWPVRLVVPRLYFWKSAKWVTGVEFVAEDEPGFWERLGYHDRGDPWREERYSERRGR